MKDVYELITRKINKVGFQTVWSLNDLTVTRTFKKRTFLALACRGRFLYCWVLKWQISASRFLNHQSVLTWWVLTVYAKPSSCFSRASPRKQFKDFCLSRTNNQGLLKPTDQLFMTSKYPREFKGVMLQCARLQKFSVNISSSSAFVTRVNLLHP